MQGYISALNLNLPYSASNNGRVGTRLDLDGVEAWLDKYCREHPTDYEAAEALYKFARDKGI